MANITKETAQKIDFLIKGVEQGKFDEVSKKIEFMQKLGGDHGAPNYLQDLLLRIDELEEKNKELEEKLSGLEMKQLNEMSEVCGELATVARAVQWLMKPDPLASELYEIENFLSKHGARKY